MRIQGTTVDIQGSFTVLHNVALSSKVAQALCTDATPIQCRITALQEFADCLPRSVALVAPRGIHTNGAPT